jgi:hypothetical protein
MRRTATETATEQTESKGPDRSPDQAPETGSSAPNQNRATGAHPETSTRTQPLERPPPSVTRNAPTPFNAPTSSSLNSELSKLNLIDRFTPEARDLQPPLVHPHFQHQMLYDQLFAYYQYRFTDIAYAHDSTIAYIAQIIPAADRVATIALNAIVNKLIIGNRTDGLPVNNFAGPVGPPKGFLFPSVSAAVITAIGKTSPEWSGDQFFIPDLNNAAIVLNDSSGNAIANIHQFPANPGLDAIVQRLCSTGSIPLRSTDWKIPGGTVHWLAVTPRVNGRINALVHADVHPDNFDPPNTVLSVLCSCTALTPNNCRYLIMRGIAETTVWSLITASAE